MQDVDEAIWRIWHLITCLPMDPSAVNECKQDKIFDKKLCL